MRPRISSAKPAIEPTIRPARVIHVVCSQRSRNPPTINPAITPAGSASAICDERREKLKKIEALGQPSYPYKYEWTHAITQILAEHSAKSREELEQQRVSVRVAGRLMSLRGQGKAGFAHLQQAGARLQIYIRLDDVGEKGFALYKLLDLGDIVGVRGYLFRTKTNELTIHAEEVTLLSKSLLPLPEKWHGLAD